MRTILITGASDGIGRAIAFRLADSETKLILFGRDATKLNAVSEKVKELGSPTETHAFDLNDSSKRRAVISEILANNQIDILVNSAGIWQKIADITELSEESIIEVINTNLTSQILLTKQLLGGMRKSEGAMIINIISRSGVMARDGKAIYTASKHGMKGFTDVLRADTINDKIRIGAIYSSGVNTKMFEKVGDSQVPVSEFIDPDELAKVVQYMTTLPKGIWLSDVHVTS